MEELLKAYYSDCYCGERSSYVPMIEAMQLCGASKANLNRGVDDSVVEQVSARRRVARALACLSDRERAVLQAAYGEGFCWAPHALPALRASAVRRFCDVPPEVMRESKRELKRIVGFLRGFYGSGE